MKRFKKYLAKLLLGTFYTEQEVYNVLYNMQYDMGQNVLKHKDHKKIIIPLDYWKEVSGDELKGDYKLVKLL